MNLVESSKMAMNLSDGQLSQALRAGTLPQFIVAAEMTRRRRTRDSGAGPQPTVVQELMTGANAIQPQPQQMPQQAPPQMPQQMPPQGMRAGGPIRMAGQGPTQLVPQSEDPTYYMERMLKPPPLVIAPPPEAATEDYLSSLIPELAKAKEKLTKSEKTQLTRALMEAGFAMMASKSPTLMGGIGEGGKAGMSAYAADKDRTQAGLLALLQDEVRVRTGQQGMADAAANRSQRNWEAGIYPQVAGHQGEVSQYMAANRAALEAGQDNARAQANAQKPQQMPSYNEMQLRYLAAAGDPTAQKAIADFDAAKASRASTGGGQRPAQFTPAQKTSIENRKAAAYAKLEGAVRAEKAKLLMNDYTKPSSFKSEAEIDAWRDQEKQRIENNYAASISAATGEQVAPYVYGGAPAAAPAAAPTPNRKLKYNPSTGKFE